MIQLATKELSIETEGILRELQATINSKKSFAEKVAEAKALWASKGNIPYKKAFEEIIATLKSMCVSVNICNYCEQNEASDTEHIDPKAFFPERTFIWVNYLRACKQCNTGYKLDKCFVIDADNIYEVK